MNIEKFTADVRAFEKNIKINSGYIALSDLKTLETLLKGADKLGDSFKKLYGRRYCIRGSYRCSRYCL